MTAKIKVLAISGSLRAKSSNSSLIDAALELAPLAMEIVAFRGLGSLPHFNPDVLSAELPDEVRSFYDLVRDVDGLMISSPEYAHGIPGSLKNALDWLVPDTDFPGKPIMLIGGGVYAQTQLTEILQTMSAEIFVNELIRSPVLRAAFDTEGKLQEPEVKQLLRASLEKFYTILKK